MRRTRWYGLVGIGLAVLLGAGCGSGGDSSTAAVPEAASNPNAEASGGGSGFTDSAPDQSVAGKDAAAQNGSGQNGSAQNGAAQNGAAGQGRSPAAAQVPAVQRNVVRTAQLTLTVDDVAAKARQAHDIAARHQGYVADEKTDDRVASIELKVASDDLDAALAALADLGRVTSRNQQAQDVTEQLVDLQSRLATQRASVERVRALLGNATAIGEIVQIESELTRRQADLESLEQRIAALDGQVQLATVSVQLSKADGGTPVDEEDLGFLGGLDAGWGAFLGTAQVLLTVLGAVLPFAVVLAVPALVVLRVLRRRRPAQVQAAAPPVAGS